MAEGFADIVMWWSEWRQMSYFSFRFGKMNIEKKFCLSYNVDYFLRGFFNEGSCYKLRKFIAEISVD